MSESVSEPGDRPRRGLGAAALTTGLLLAGLVVAPFPGGGDGSGCPPSVLAVEGAPPGAVALRRGQEVTVTGRGFVEGCDDDGGPRARTDVELALVGGRVSRRVTPLARADAGTAAEGRLGRISWTVTVPEGQATGPAVLRAEVPGGVGYGVSLRILPAE